MSLIHQRARCPFPGAVAGIFALALLIAARVSVAASGELPITDADGCTEGDLNQFGAYIGNWIIEDETLQPDGKTWLPGKGARWLFVCVGNGVAVQDYWLTPAGGVGTNLRMYNPKTGSWDVAWTSTATPGMAHIVAKLEADTGNMVMTYQSPVPEPPRRIVFFPVEDDGWRWQQEWSFDGGKTYQTVYRIRARRAQ